MTHEPLNLARWYFTWTCTLTTARILFNFKVRGQGHFFRQWTKVHQIVSSHVEKIVVDNAVFRLSIGWSVPEIFTMKLGTCPESSALIDNLAWWNFTRACTLTTSRTVLNFKVNSQCHMGFGVFFWVPNAAATCGQIEAWWSRIENWFYHSTVDISKVYNNTARCVCTRMLNFSPGLEKA